MLIETINTLLIYFRYTSCVTIPSRWRVPRARTGEHHFGHIIGQLDE